MSCQIQVMVHRRTSACAKVWTAATPSIGRTARPTSISGSPIHRTTDIHFRQPPPPMASLEERVARLEAASAAASGSTAQIGELLNLMWFLLTACMIFVMQCGFCMLEAGSIRKKNVKNMLMKNLMDVCVACIAWLLIGHGLASDGSGGFIGEMGLLSSNATMSQLAAWTQELMYATTSVTIVSGALAERAHLGSYALSSFVTAALSCELAKPVERESTSQAAHAYIISFPAPPRLSGVSSSRAALPRHSACQPP
jgi:hypothetical protein